MKEIFSNPAVLWFIFGFALLILEFIVPGLVLLFFAVGAWIVGLLTMFFDISFNMQLVTFLGCSILFLLAFRSRIRKTTFGKRLSNEVMEDEFLGKTAKAETAISPGHKGKVIFKGTAWDAVSDDIIQPGEYVTITGNESIILKVKSNTK